MQNGQISLFFFKNFIYLFRANFHIVQHYFVKFRCCTLGTSGVQPVILNYFVLRRNLNWGITFKRALISFKRAYNKQISYEIRYEKMYFDKIDHSNWKFMKILEKWNTWRVPNLVRFRNIGKKFQIKKKKADFTFVTSDEFRCIGLQHFDRSIITGVEPHNIIRAVCPSVKLSKV